MKTFQASFALKHPNLVCVIISAFIHCLRNKTVYLHPSRAYLYRALPLSPAKSGKPDMDVTFLLISTSTRVVFIDLDFPCSCGARMYGFR